MLRTFLLAFLVGCAAISASSQGQDESFNEYQDSPTYFIEGCGRFPAIRLIVNGQETEGRAFIRNNRTYIPAREALERLGGNVTWVGAQRSFFTQIPEQDRTVRVTVGSPTVIIYRYNQSARYGAGARVGSVRLNAAPFQCEGTVFAPVRAAAEAAGATVRYDRASRTVYINSPRSTRSTS